MATGVIRVPSILRPTDLRDSPEAHFRRQKDGRGRALRHSARQSTLELAPCIYNKIADFLVGQNATPLKSADRYMKNCAQVTHRHSDLTSGVLAGLSTHNIHHICCLLCLRHTLSLRYDVSYGFRPIGLASEAALHGWRPPRLSKVVVTRFTQQIPFLFR